MVIGRVLTVLFWKASQSKAIRNVVNVAKYKYTYTEYNESPRTHNSYPHPRMILYMGILK